MFATVCRWLKKLEDGVRDATNKSLQRCMELEAVDGGVACRSRPVGALLLDKHNNATAE